MFSEYFHVTMSTSYFAYSAVLIVITQVRTSEPSELLNPYSRQHLRSLVDSRPVTVLSDNAILPEWFKKFQHPLPPHDSPSEAKRSPAKTVALIDPFTFNPYQLHRQILPDDLRKLLVFARLFSKDQTQSVATAKRSLEALAKLGYLKPNESSVLVSKKGVSALARNWELPTKKTKDYDDQNPDSAPPKRNVQFLDGSQCADKLNLNAFLQRHNRSDPTAFEDRHMFQPAYEFDKRNLGSFLKNTAHKYDSKRFSSSTADLLDREYKRNLQAILKQKPKGNFDGKRASGGHMIPFLDVDPSKRSVGVMAKNKDLPEGLRPGKRAEDSDQLLKLQFLRNPLVDDDSPIEIALNDDVTNDDYFDFDYLFEDSDSDTSRGNPDSDRLHHRDSDYDSSNSMDDSNEPLTLPSKRYYAAVRGGGRMLGGRLYQLGRGRSTSRRS